MADINLHIKKNMFVPKFYPHLFDYSHRWSVYMGSAGSAKSYFITQKLIIKAIKNTRNILVCRRYATTLRDSVFSLFKEVLTKWKIIQYCKVNESFLRISFPNGSVIMFKGLDEEAKLLSLADISDVFIEEAYEVSKDLVEQLNLRMRGSAPSQEIILAFNPINKSHWLYNFCEVEPPESFLYVHSTYKDNPFLPEDYVKSLTELEERNPMKYRIYGLGEWGIDSEGLVFTNWKVENFEIDAEKWQHRVGVDFGYRDASAIIETFYDADNKRIYVSDEFIKCGCQLDELYNSCINMHLNKVKIYADSAEPRTIDYFRGKGLNMYPCIKGQNSVSARIAFLQNNQIIVHPRCKKFIEELENFSYIKSKKTNEYTDDTTHEYSHGIDACGYAYSDIYKNNRVKVFDKRLLI